MALKAPMIQLFMTFTSSPTALYLTCSTPATLTFLLSVFPNTHHRPFGLLWSLPGAYSSRDHTPHPLTSSRVLLSCHLLNKASPSHLVIRAIPPSLVYFFSLLVITVCTLYTKYFIHYCIAYHPLTRVQVWWGQKFLPVLVTMVSSVSRSSITICWIKNIENTEFE